MNGFQVAFEYDFYKWLNIGVGLGSHIGQSAFDNNILYIQDVFSDIMPPCPNYRDAKAERYLDVMVGFMPLNNKHNRLTFLLGLGVSYFQQTYGWLSSFEYMGIDDFWTINTLRFEDPQFWEVSILAQLSYDYVFTPGWTIGAILFLRSYFLNNWCLYPGGGLSVGYAWGDMAYKNKKK